MTPENKKFILKKLIPFILREQGRGFQMSQWIIKKSPLKESTAFYNLDLHKEIKWPKCGTACCIGGSIRVLLAPNGGKLDIPAVLGLSELEAYGLFYNWDGIGTTGWPKAFATKYEKAKTPLAKAKVAVALLKEVVRTEGKCLHRS